MEQAVLSTGPDGVVRASHLAFARMGGEPAAAAFTPPAAFDQTLPEMERDVLLRALQRTAGNVSRAARDLGISRDTMRYRMTKYGLDGRDEG
jgi:DNA-binding NtrC family response regulator